MMEEGEFFEIPPSVQCPPRDNYPYYGDGTGRSEPITIRNIKIRSDSDVQDSEDLPKKDTMRRSPLFNQPKGTLQYTVKGNDTLDSIALHFESTPTQLMRLNHLSSRMLYPGQTLYVPDPDSTEPICLSPSSTTKKSFDLPVVSQKEEREPVKTQTDLPVVSQSPDVAKATQSKTATGAKRFLLLKSKSKEEKTPSSRKRGRKSLLRYETEPRPGRVIRDRSTDEDAEESKNFLKLNVKYITDGEGVVSGTMLVTPNAIMFDPNVSDPLVKERGTSPYGVITQMDAVRGAAMYHDISAMNLKTKEQCPQPGTCPVYVPASATEMGTGGLGSPDATSSPTAESSQTLPDDALTRTNSDAGLSQNSNPSAESGRDSPQSPSAPGMDDDGGSAEPASEQCRPPTAEGAVQSATSTNAEGAKGGDVTPEPRTDDAVVVGDPAEIIAATEIGDSGDQVVPSDPNGALPDVIESAAQSAKDSGAPSCETGAPSGAPPADSESAGVRPKAAAGCPFCGPARSRDWKKRLEADDDGGGGGGPSTSPARGFVDFSSGMFVRDCPRCAAVVPDIAESVRDAGAAERELRDIRAAGLQIRQASEEACEEQPRVAAATGDDDDAPGLNGETPEGTAGDGGGPARPDPEAKDVNKEVILGYNRTNFEDGEPKEEDLQTETKEGTALKSHQSIRKKEYLPKPAQRYDDPPLYLCLRVGRPMSKTFPGAGSGGAKAGGNKRQHKLPEYWFAIPREKADSLYAFFLQWSPDVYGKEGRPDDVGFVAVDDDLESSLEVIEDFFEEPVGKDWEIITKEEANRRRMTILECEMNLPLPELEGATSILLEREHVRKLTKQLPARTEGYSWKNIYSTAEHGYSLRNLYRSMSGIDSPVLMVIRDSSGMIFGALSPCPVKVSEHYYGTGETFLFNFVDWELNVYRWTGENNFFIKGSQNSLTLGGGDGAFGLWLDGDLYRGRSRSCKTFSNPCLAHDEDFIIADLEAWGFCLA